MALLLKPLRCPHCNQPIDKRLLRQRDLFKTFLDRKVFPCPHCEKGAVLPEKAETMVSMGIFVTVILAPLFMVWELTFIEPRSLFALGAAILIVGLMTQKLEKAPLNQEQPDE